MLISELYQLMVFISSQCVTAVCMGCQMGQNYVLAIVYYTMPSITQPVEEGFYVIQHTDDAPTSCPRLHVGQEIGDSKPD